MAKYFSGLHTVMEILREVNGLPRRNKKIFLFIMLSTLIPYFLLIFATIHSRTTIIIDLSMNAIPLVRMDPKSTQYGKRFFKMKEDTVLMILLEVMFFFLMSAVTLFSMVATIHVSAMSYFDKELTLKDLFSKLKKNWIGPVITWFYFTLMSAAGNFVVILPLCVLLVLTKGSSLFSMVATIHVSAMSYLDKDLTLKDLFLKFKKNCIGPVITWFYFTLMSAGYFVTILPLYVLLVLTEGSFVVAAVGFVPVLFVIFFNIYLNTVWMLSLVISVVEDCYGLQALGKGEQLMKGRKVVGFGLTFISVILLGVNFFLAMISKHHQTVMLTSAILVKILNMMMYTIFYFDCKQCHAEHVEIEENIEYSTIFTKFDDTALPRSS